MSAGGQQLDIDTFLLRFNKLFGDDMRIYFAYIQPVMGAVSLIVCIFTLAAFHQQRERLEQTGLRRLLSAIIVIDAVSILTKIPVLAMLSADENTYKDYVEFKWCDIFFKTSNDVPLVAHNIVTLFKYGLVIHSLILVFAPSKETIWLTSQKTIAFCVIACIGGILMYIPNMYLADFILVKWLSKLNDRERRDCCVIFPKQSIAAIPYYQRNVFVATLCVTGGGPILAYTVCGLIIAFKLRRMRTPVRRSINSSQETFRQRQVCKAVAVCLFGFALLNIPFVLNTTLATLVYGQVELPFTQSELQTTASNLTVATGVFVCAEVFMIPVIFIIFDKRFKSVFLRVIRFKCRPEKKSDEECQQAKEEDPATCNPDLEQQVNGTTDIAEQIEEATEKRDDPLQSYENK